jgi:hypothetical protein
LLIAPGNPTAEPGMNGDGPAGVSVHISRRVARGPTGTQHGQEERNPSQIEHLAETASLLAMVKPSVMVIAHTAMSCTLGKSAEAELMSECNAELPCRLRRRSALRCGTSPSQVKRAWHLTAGDHAQVASRW